MVAAGASLAPLHNFLQEGMSQKTTTISDIEDRRERKTWKVVEHNEIWLGFLDCIFIKTVDQEELEKLGN